MYTFVARCWLANVAQITSSNEESKTRGPVTLDLEREKESDKRGLKNLLGPWIVLESVLNDI